MCNLNAKGLHIFVVGERQALVPNTSGTGGMPRIGQELGCGAEGVVSEDLDQPGWVVKEFHKGATSPFQARNEFQNLERARRSGPTTWSRPRPLPILVRGSSSKREFCQRMCRRIWPRKPGCFKTSFPKSPMPEGT